MAAAGVVVVGSASDAVGVCGFSVAFVVISWISVVVAVTLVVPVDVTVEFSGCLVVVSLCAFPFVVDAGLVVFIFLSGLGVGVVVEIGLVVTPRKYS